mgnify:CR=1 FL=1
MNKILFGFMIGLLVEIIGIIIIMYLIYNKKLRIDVGKDIDENIRQLIYTTDLLPRDIPLKQLITPTKDNKSKEYIKLSLL